MIHWSLSRMPVNAREEDLHSDAQRIAFRSFGSPRRRREWAAGRTAARMLAAAALRCPAEGIEIAAIPGGPPRARARGEDLPIALSLAHAGDWLLCAGRPGPAGAPLGTDLEPLSPRRRGVLLRALNELEIAALAAGDPARLSLEELLQIWVVKEAVLKASGRGLAVSPRRVTVRELSPASLPTIVPTSLDGRPARVWAWRDARLALAIAWLGDSPEELAPSISVDD